MAKDFAHPKSRKIKQDDSVIATNNSSIVSKRSVERLYYPEPHFYRYFVKKPLRRSPLINRGYWLRMHAVEQVIKRFLDEPSDQQKIVLNLGCGYDPLAFQWLSNDALKCRDTKFVDVDFPELMAKKKEIIVNTPQLRNLLGSHQTVEDSSGIHLRSKHYSALGCDLTDIPKLEALLTNEMDLSGSLILCVAEVSITYMDVEAADSLIHWAANHKDIRFCLLEQYLPDGAGHPFAQRMIEHFDRLDTPLRSVHKYPTLTDQELRFRQRGWSLATARSLWDLWSDPLTVSLEQRTALNLVEPFDEWEEFILFSSHYFVMEAANDSPKRSAVVQRPGPLQPEKLPGHIELWSGTPFIARSEPIPKANVRRFGALVQLSSDALGYHGGLGSQTRMGTMDLYGHVEAGSLTGLVSTSIPPRMCHSITALDQDRSLLVGGRTSPDTALKDCWVFCEHWDRVEDIPMALFRQCATQVNVKLANQNKIGVLIYGGKTDRHTISNKWLLWREGFGWIQLNVIGHSLAARFGAAMASTGPGVGILVGGMGSDGLIVSEIWEWSISGSTKDLSISLRPVELLAEAPLAFEGDLVQRPYYDSRKPLIRNIIGRIGAHLVNSQSGMLLIGGASIQNLAQDMDFVILTKGNNNESGTSVWHCATLNIEAGSQRPLLVGHSSLSFRNKVVIIGGGAVCFSFGTYWNHCLVTLSIDDEERCIVLPLPVRKAEQLPKHTLRKEVDLAMSPAAAPSLPLMVKSERIGSAQDFDYILGQGRPVVFRNSQLGPCTSYWTVDGLKEKIGPDRAVVVHEAFDTHMNFQEKNFSYVKKPFKTFIDEISGGSRQYLRSIASIDPSGTPASLWVDFPELGPEFELPSEYDTVKENIHSSVLRISGPHVTMWLHYDVMANVLCQIKGTKRLVLYPPSDVSVFSLPPGTSSSSINCFDVGTGRDPALTLAHPQEAFLEPGDVLFIPPLWLHTASPMDNVSISVNVFFRNLEHGYAPGRDVYGNRDLQAYEKGRKDIAKIAESFDKLPPGFGRFYLERLADELRTKALRYGL